MNPSSQNPLPGDLSGKTLLEHMLRVNHAGEYGARRIYAGQLAVLKHHACAPTIRHMAEQEDAHFETFDQMLKDRQVRPTALMPIWHVLGFALGAGTALLGEKAAMACTVAVESVIDDHYREQLAELPESEAALGETIEQFRQEEMEHHDTGLAHQAEQAPFYPLLSGLIKTGSRLAIALSKRI